MPNLSVMRRRTLTCVAAVVLLAPLLTGLPASAEPPGSFCDDPHHIVGIGTATQSGVHASHFVPRYVEVCPAAQGRVAYQGAGDETGVQALIAHDIRYTFYASDLALTTLEKQQAEKDTSTVRFRVASVVHHVPVLVNGFAVSYNLGGCEANKPLRLSGETLSLIYSGLVTRWNDPLIVRDNPHYPELGGCTIGIKPAVRSDPAGPTIIFKEYLSKKNPVFQPYTAKQLNTMWPSTLTPVCRGSGEGGMGSCIGDPGAIGYIEFREAAARGLRVAALENAVRGQFVTPAPNGATWPSNCVQAANSVVVPQTVADWSQVSLTNSSDGYPICGFTYEFTFNQPLYSYGAVSVGAVRNTYDYLMTIVSDRVQDGLPRHGYAPLPASVRATARMGISQIYY